MTLRIKIENEGPHDAVVNVWETASPADLGKNIECHDLKPGEATTVTIYGWRRGVTVLEAGAAE